MREIKSVVVVIVSILLSTSLSAQFSERGMEISPPGANVQQVDREDTLSMGEGRESYTLKRYFKSLAGKDSMSISTMWAGSLILPGSAQLYNKQYWKIPAIYLSVGGLATAAYSNNLKWQKSGETKYRNNRDILYGAAAVTYWASIMDGIANYKYPLEVAPPRAALYSAMLPGLGQIYNGDYWKLPIYYGGFLISGYFISHNNRQYSYYKNLYYTTSDPEHADYKRYNAQTMKYYMDVFRRYRDYSILAGVLVYALNIIDANVFAHLQSFDISDDLTASFGGSFSQYQPLIAFQLSYKF